MGARFGGGKQSGKYPSALPLRVCSVDCCSARRLVRDVEPQAPSQTN